MILAPIRGRKITVIGVLIVSLVVGLWEKSRGNPPREQSTTVSSVFCQNHL